MEQLLVQAIVQKTDIVRTGWSSLCSYWEWGFWVGVVIGLVGAGVLYLMKPVDTT